MKKILLIEDSKIVGGKYKSFLEKETQYTVTWVKDMQETLDLLSKTTKNDYLLAIVDLHLPDCEPGDAVDETIKPNQLEEIDTEHDVLAYNLSHVTQRTQNRSRTKPKPMNHAKAFSYEVDKSCYIRSNKKHVVFTVTRPTWIRVGQITDLKLFIAILQDEHFK